MLEEFNMNSFVKIKLTLEGKYYLNRIKYLGQTVSGLDILTREDENGYIRLRFWEFMKIFGGFIEEPYKNYFFEDSIFIDTDTNKKSNKKISL